MAGEAGDGWRWGLEMAGDGVKIRWGEMNGYVATVQSHMSKQVILTVETVHGLFPMMTGLRNGHGMATSLSARSRN